jgi:hypothetical protein
MKSRRLSGTQKKNNEGPEDAGPSVACIRTSEALERLAAWSLLARWIDQSVVSVPGGTG